MRTSNYFDDVAWRNIRFKTSSSYYLGLANPGWGKFKSLYWLQFVPMPGRVPNPNKLTSPEDEIPPTILTQNNCMVS